MGGYYKKLKESNYNGPITMEFSKEECDQLGIEFYNPLFPWENLELELSHLLKLFIGIGERTIIDIDFKTKYKFHNKLNKYKI